MAAQLIFVQPLVLFVLPLLRGLDALSRCFFQIGIGLLFCRQGQCSAVHVVLELCIQKQAGGNLGDGLGTEGIGVRTFLPWEEGTRPGLTEVLKQLLDGCRDVRTG